MSIKSTSVSMSKEMSVEESYSKTSVSSSTSISKSSKLESEMSITSSGEVSSILDKADSGIGSSIVEKSASSLMESDDSFSFKKSEMSASVDKQETSQTTSMKAVSEEVSVSKTASLSKSESISSEVSEEKDSQIYVVIMDYSPRPSDVEGLPVSEGQEVEVVDSSKAHKWRVKLRQNGVEGTVPSCYLEKKAEPTPPTSPQLDAKAQAAKARREKVLKELVESEEEFARDMQYVVNNYIKEMESKSMPKNLRDYKDALFNNFQAISEFHNNVLMKGIQYYADDPDRLGKTFLRLERDFDKHVAYCRDEPEAQQLLATEGPLKEYFDEFSKKLNDEKTLSEHLKLPIQRINDYQLLLKELIKHTSRLKENTTDLEKAHDFMQAIPQRISDLQYINSIQGYKGNLHKLGRILKHDWFEVTDGNNLRRERFLFLFKGRIFITDHKRVGTNRAIYLVKNVIKLSDVEIVDNADDDDLKLRFQSLKKGAPGYPLTLKSKTIEQKNDWLNIIQATAGPQEEEPDEEDFDLTEDHTMTRTEETETKVEIIEDFEAYEEMHTVITESVRSGSLTSLEEGTEVVLECEVCSNPEATIAWLKDNSPLVADKRRILETDNGKHRLVIKKSECIDSGLYTIIASNVNGTTSCSAPLTISSAPDAVPPTTPDGTIMPYGPIFREKLRNIELQEGTDFRVCIIVEGEPRPTVKFYKDDKEISTSGRIRYAQEGKGCYELIIDKATSDDAGKYSCVAVSTAGQNVTSCEVTITRPKVFVKVEEDLDKTETPDILDDDIQWPKDNGGGKEVESSERFQVSIDESEDTVSLVFQHVTPDDAGMYTCVASTSSGKISCSAELTVQGGLPREPEAPKVSAQSSVVEAKEGESALLELTATGFPKPKITWTKDGKECKPGEKYVVLQEDEETFTMAIKNITPEDSGKYAAEAVNELGKDDVTYDLKVTSPPKFIKPMKDTSVMIDENLEFSLEIEGNPEPKITWCKDGQELKEGGRIKMVTKDKTHKLIIEKAKPEDAGNYSCNIKNENGSQVGFGAAQVNSPAKFTQGLKDITCNIDEEASFNVAISGNPKPTIKWKKDGSELKVDGTHVIEEEETKKNYTLRIKKTTKKDEGDYSCEISNTYGKDNSSAKLTVKEKPNFTQKLKDMTVKEGDQDVDLVAKVAGTPIPKIKWYIGDMLITESANYKIISEETSGTYTLRMKKVTTEMAGDYMCEASNESGKTTTTSKVTVEEVTTKKETEEKIVETKITKEETVTETKTEKEEEKTEKEGEKIEKEEEKTKKDEAPKVKQGLKDIKVKEGEDAEFTIKFSGKPKPKTKWNKDGADLTIDGKHFEYKTESDEDSLTLIMHKACVDDSGTYTCTLFNDSGSESTSSNVSVSADVKAPSFRKTLKDQEITEGETANFTVVFDGKPKPKAIWNKDGAELTIDKKHFEEKYEEAEDSLTLILHEASKDDAGNYSCIIKNSAGSEETKSKLVVKDSTKAPKFTQGLKDIKVTEEDVVELTVRYEGKPMPKVKWQKDGKDLAIDNDHFEIETEDDTETLIINDVTMEDTGNYSCLITNSIGTETTSGNLTVKEFTNAPKFTKGLKDQNVKEEQTVNYTVKFSGKPKPTAKWTKDGADLTIDGKHIQYKTEEAGDSLTLIINQVTKDDAGKYSCTITNSSGSETTSSKLTVSDATESPDFTKKLKDIDVKEGSTTEMHVKFIGKPKPIAKWTFDGAELTIDGSHIKLKSEENDTSLTLVINNATKEDAGKYACVITNTHGSQTTSGKLTISIAPIFTKTLEDVEGEVGGVLKLNVKFEGQPEPQATWFKDGMPLEMDGRHLKSALENDDSLTLVIDKVKPEDVGKYTCEIKNPHGTAKTSANATVTGKPSIKKPLSDKEVAEDETSIELIVEAMGTPAPEIKWHLNGKELIENEIFKMSKDPIKGVYKLTLTKATSEIEGEYKFLAKNESGSVETSGKLKILKKPLFTKELKDMTLVEDDTLKLEVAVVGYPTPEVKWYLGKTLLEPNETLKISSDGTNHSLTIDEASLEDSGSYTCKAKNVVGEGIQKATVTVKSKKATQSPMFITHLHDQTIVVGDAVRFEVKVTGKPQPEVAWYRDNEELKSQDQISIKSNAEDNSYTLTIKDLKIGDSATYSCIAVNQYGDVKESAKLTVKEPEEPKIEGLEDVEVSFGSPVRIKAKIFGFPLPDVKWMKGDKQLKTKDDIYELTSEPENNKYAVSINSVKDNEIGQYVCIASNMAGEIQAQCKLSIKAQAPAFSKEIKDRSIDVGETFSFEVEVYGYPTPEITWFKDNKALDVSNRITMSKTGDFYKLEGKDAQNTDAGVIRCVAKNKAGEVSCKATLKILDFAPEVIGKLPKTINLLEGDKLTLQAKISGQPTPKIKWVKDGKPLKIGNKVQSSFAPDGTTTLTIDDVTHDDSGRYEIMATNDKGHVSNESDVSVAFREKSTKPFVGQLHPIDVTVGSPILLEAKVTGNPKPLIEWFKDGEKITDGGTTAHVRILDLIEGKAALSIEMAKLEDAGEYKITAKNDQGEDNSSTKVNVAVPGKKPAIVKELKAGKFLEGEDGKLEAIVSGYPKPNIAWMHNGKNVLEGKHCIINLEDNGLATLNFIKVTPEDAGMYTIIATNKLGKAFSEAPVIVVPASAPEAEKKTVKIFEFIQGLMPQLVPEGQPCKLEAQVTTDPKPISIKWTKDNKDIPPTERIEMGQDSAGFLKLCIKHMTSADRGRYAVIVSDGNTEIKSEALLNMMPSMPGMSGNKPYFIKGLEPLRLSEGETIQLQAMLPPNSNCSIKWMKDGEEIVKDDRTQIADQSNGAISLRIEAANPDDSGKYVVVATNEEGKTRSSAMVAVIGTGFKPPEIIDSVKPSMLTEGEPGRIVAKVNGEPKPEIKWLHNGEPLSPSEHYKIVEEPDGTVALDIDEVKPADEGKYTLIISNLGGELRTSTVIEVKQPPLFTPTLQSVVGVEGYPAKFECKISGNPTPEIKWLKDGSAIPADDANIHQQYLPNGEAYLIIDKCKPENVGTYSCIAKNMHGEKSSNAALKVINKEVEGEAKSAPSFVTPLSDVKVSEGETFKLEAAISGNPLPEAHWFLDEQPVSLSRTIIPAFDGKKASLTINRCNPQHEGVYECKLTNILGEASSKSKVSVLGNKAPKFIERLSEMKFTTNEPLKLTCRVEGIPEPNISWYFNGDKVETGLKYSVLKEGDKCILAVPHPRAKDSGIYECRAKNIAGEDSCKANITVSGADFEGEAPMFLKKLRDISVINGMTAKLTACICGSPHPEIKWFKDGKQLGDDPRQTIEADRNGVIRLIIRGVNKSDIATYRVSISNMLGSDTCTANLNIEGDDKQIKIEKPRKEQEVKKPSLPSPPTPLAHAPYIFKMTDTSISLGWRPSVPLYPQVPFTYCLEMCKIPDGQWTTYKSGIKDSACDVQDLEPATDYMFRISVQNKYGTSDPSPFVTAHRTKLYRPLTPGEYMPKDYELEHLAFDKYAAPPRFLRQEQECTYAVRGHPARIDFWVYGCPQPKITWYFNNIEVEPGKYDFLEDRNGQVILFITRMAESDVGVYMCKAVNEFGEAQRKIKLMIAEAPVFLKRLDPVTTMIRKNGEFTCRVIGVPNPKVKWFKDWHPLSDSSRITIQWQEPDTSTLTLTNAILKDSALYTCTATNVAGTATTSAMLNVEESENEYHILTYKRPAFAKPSERPFEDHYDIGDELGRGTQGITYHVVDRGTGKSYAAKVMHGTGKLMDYMTAEMDVMNQLCHPRLIRLWNAHSTQSSLTLATDICGGGELLPHLLHQGNLTESIVAHYIKQILEGLKHMHEKDIAHLGLTLGDILVTRLNSDNIKIGDFGLATHLYSGREYIQEYGHPEFVAPEVANKLPVTLAADMWSVGVIAYILLVGISPFLRENDRETLKEVQKGQADFYHDGFAVLSDDARDFVTRLLQPDPSNRMDVNTALKHKWLEIASLPDKGDELNNADRLRDYHKKWRTWYSNASCRRYYRRRPLDSCFTHPSRMIYPPEEKYTPTQTPDRDLSRSHVKPAAFDDVTYQQKIEREPIDVRSESHYQNGPDTFLLPLRDPDFPVRVRRYLKIGAYRSPLLARHLKDKHWGYSNVAVKERRKFVDVMDEEIDDERKGVSRSAPLRIRHEVGTVGLGYDHVDIRAQKKKRGFRMPSGTPPYFRVKIKDVVIREEEEAVFSCQITTDPEPHVSWFRNDGILIGSSRIIMSQWSDGRCSLTLRPAKAYDVGVYKCVARNAHGVTVCRARLNLGSVCTKPDPPKAEKCSDTEIYLTWLPPKFDGHSPNFGYALEYKEKDAENWTKIANNIPHEFYLVRNLAPNTTYLFRVCTVNKFGWSEFSLDSDPIMTLAESAPKIELGRAEKFQQDQTDSGAALIPETVEEIKWDYGREEDPLVLEEIQPTELYNYVSEVSRGRFSIVMKIWHKKLNTTFCAKVCQVNESAKREFEIYKSLQHEKIANLYSASISPTAMFLVMEKLSGIDILTYLSSRPLYTEETVSRIIRQVIDALEYLHFRGICYFELQPDNVVMVDRYNIDIKLVDFGTAQYVPEGGAKVDVKGSLEYLAPEVVKGEEVHTPADIWGVGVLMYILLSGVSPFAGDSLAETKDNVLYVRYHFDHLYKEVTQEATHFLMQLFKRTPQKRPTAEECLENKWLLPNEYMIKKREHAVFLSHRLREFSEQFHSTKSKNTPLGLLNIFK